MSYLSIVLKNLNNRKLRALLTITGIIIGVAAIVALFAVSQGLQNAITAQFEEIGTDKIFVFPKSSIQSGNIPVGLTTKDVKTVEKLPYFDDVTSYIVNSGFAEFGKEKEFFLQLNGIEAEDTKKAFQSIGREVEEGRFFKKNEKFVVIIGAKVAEDIFDKEVRIGNKLKVKDQKLTVVGILESVGNPDDDSAVYMPMNTARQLFDKPDEVNFIQLDVKQGVDINFVAQKVKDRLEDVRDKEDFEVLTPEQFLETFGNILGVVQAVLGGIAAISILVGAIVIMNSMYTSVLERTKEIGIMKAIGARNSSIVLLFLIESALIGLVGGIIGVVLGSGIAKLVEVIASQAGFEILLIKINPSFILFGLGFAVIIGIISGTLPAIQASKLQPVDALRG